MTEYCYSLDEERFEGSFATREDAEAEGRSIAEDDDTPNATVWTGVAVAYEPKVPTWMVIERLQEDAFEVVGEVSEGWMKKVKPEALDALGERLTAAFNAWALEYGHEPKFWQVENIIEHAAPRVPSSQEPA